MKLSDRLLQRLLGAAARAPETRPVPEPSPRLEAAALAEWRSAIAPDEWAPLVSLFRRAVICSGLIMLLSVSWGWLQSRSQASDATYLADYAMTIQLPP